MVVACLLETFLNCLEYPFTKTVSYGLVFRSQGILYSVKFFVRITRILSPSKVWKLPTDSKPSTNQGILCFWYFSRCFDTVSTVEDILTQSLRHQSCSFPFEQLFFQCCRNEVRARLFWCRVLFRLVFRVRSQAQFTQKLLQMKKNCWEAWTALVSGTYQQMASMCLYM